MTKTTRPSHLNTYTVLLTFQFPAWDEIEGIEFYVAASTKAMAIKTARRHAERCGHMDRLKGRKVFRVVNTAV